MKRKKKYKKQMEKPIVRRETKVLPAYNRECKYLSDIGGECSCDIKMEMFFCGNNCPYATTNGELASVPYKAQTLIYGRR